MFDSDQARGMRMQGAGHIVFAVLPGGGDGGLLSTTRPGESDAWIEVDVCLIDEEDFGVGIGGIGSLLNRLEFLGLCGVA